MMIHAAERRTTMAVGRSLARWSLELHRGGPAIRYGVSVVCVALALGAALTLQYYGFRGVELPLFDLAIVVTTRYAATGPAVLALVLSTACFDYFFVEPLYSLQVSTEDLAYFPFAAVAAIVA